MKKFYIHFFVHDVTHICVFAGILVSYVITRQLERTS